MKKNFTKVFALFLILAMLCTGCGLSGAPVDKIGRASCRERVYPLV